MTVAIQAKHQVGEPAFVIARPYDQVLSVVKEPAESVGIKGVTHGSSPEPKRCELWMVRGHVSREL